MKKDGCLIYVMQAVIRNRNPPCSMRRLFRVVTNSFPAAAATCFRGGSTLSGTHCIAHFKQFLI
jgi:hypothetical protein